jgi:hypothetical protein
MPKNRAQLPYHPKRDPYDTEVKEVKLAPKEESKANILKQYSHYIDRLAVFHTNTMELLRHIDFHWVGTDNRLATKAKINALIKQGKELEYNDSHINFPNSHNSYGVKDFMGRESEDEIYYQEEI